MAEIKIEKKKPVWPWILLALIILGIILYFVFADNDNEIDDVDENNTEQIEDTTYTSTQTSAGEVGTLAGTTSDTLNGDNVSNYIAHVGDKSRMGIDHEYTNNALIHLVEAVNSKASEFNVNVSTDMQSIRQDAQQITQNRQATNHANKIKDAGTKLAEVLKKIQEQQFPNLAGDVEEVKTPANNIKPSVQTLEQKDQVNKFFDEAADVLKKMS